MKGEFEINIKNGKKLNGKLDRKINLRNNKREGDVKIEMKEKK
jgi:antitoxin component YwqK of YwqJK toxin-antitoxin module